MKAIITCPFIPISWLISSHRAAQAVIYADQFRSKGWDVDVNWSGKIVDYDKYDVALFYHGNDYKGSQVNLFGDVTLYPYAWNTLAFFKYKGPVISLAIPFPPYHDYIQKKIDSAKARGRRILSEFLELDMNNIRRMHETAETVQFPVITDKLVVGDSHAISMYRPGWTVNSVPFKTLHGALNMGLDNFVHQVADPFSFKEVEFYFGNIDIRHHLMRQPDPEGATRKLASDYAATVATFGETYGLAASIYEPLPIEDESRKVPTTGKYKGTAFFGSRLERENLRSIFCEEVFRYSGRVRLIEWTDYLKDHEGKLDFKYMEKPHSIHLSREFYPWWQGERGTNPSTPGTSIYKNKEADWVSEEKKRLYDKPKSKPQPEPTASLENFFSE